MSMMKTSNIGARLRLPNIIKDKDNFGISTMSLKETQAIYDKLNSLNMNTSTMSWNSTTRNNKNICYYGYKKGKLSCGYEAGEMSDIQLISFEEFMELNPKGPKKKLII